MISFFSDITETSIHEKVWRLKGNETFLLARKKYGKNWPTDLSKIWESPGIRVELNLKGRGVDFGKTVSQDKEKQEQ